VNLIKERIKRTSGRNHGEVFTHKCVVDYLLDEVNYKSHLNLSSVKILEPAAGAGSFAREILKRLFDSSLLYGFSFIEALESNICFVELSKINYTELIFQLNKTVNSLGIKYDFSKSRVLLNDDFLAINFDRQFDCIVGNPPYVRHELISEDLKRFYRKNYGTFKYRADLYIIFFEHSLRLLNKNGILSFICSNRWFYNQYGKLLRDKIAKNYHLHKIINMEKANPFDENVTAYPGIATIVNSRDNGTTLIYETNKKDVNLEGITFTEVRSPLNDSWQNLFLNYNLNHQALTSVVNQGFEIGIGVATGADKVFIRNEKEIKNIEKTRLLPIVTSRDLTEKGINWENQYLINPYEEGRLCDLDNYPKLKQYFNNQKELLLNRYVVRKTPDKWYKTIDNIKVDLLLKPKLLLPDIAGINRLIIDEGHYYPHHSLYYITSDNICNLKILACILMSDFVREQLSQIGICMNGGSPRFQSQTLKKLRIPNINSLNSFDKSKLSEAYENIDYELMNRIINKYCAKQSIVSLSKQKKSQSISENLLVY